METLDDYFPPKFSDGFDQHLTIHGEWKNYQVGEKIYPLGVHRRQPGAETIDVEARVVEEGVALISDKG